MSSPTPDRAQPVTSGRRLARRLLFVLARGRDLLAVIGVAMLALGGWLYQQGAEGFGEMDPRARSYLAQAGWDALQGNVAEALSTRVPIAEGTTPEAVETALRARAIELGIPLLPLYPRLDSRGDGEPDSGEAVPSDDADDTDPVDFSLRVWSACYPDDVATMVALEPQLLAFMPCRLALHRDAAGRLWLATTNLELLVSGGREPIDSLRRVTVRVRDRMLDLMASVGG